MGRNAKSKLKIFIFALSKVGSGVIEHNIYLVSWNALAADLAEMTEWTSPGETCNWSNRGYFAKTPMELNVPTNRPLLLPSKANQDDALYWRTRIAEKWRWGESGQAK